MPIKARVTWNATANRIVVTLKEVESKRGGKNLIVEPKTQKEIMAKRIDPAYLNEEPRPSENEKLIENVQAGKILTLGQLDKEYYKE